jgi:2-dehydropantoate 2-reductase
MKVCVIGAGAIGATIGARLFAATGQVCLVARGAHLDAMRRDGLRFIDQVGSASGVYRVPASDRPSDFGPQDLVIICCKAYALQAVLAGIGPLLGPQTVVLPALNGLPWWYFHREGGHWNPARLRSLDPDGTLERALDLERVIGCVVHLAAERLQAGVVQHTGGRRLIIGEPDGSVSDRVRRVQAVLREAGFDSEVSPQIRRDIWAKLIGNLSFNPVAALTGYRMDQICADPVLLEPIRQALAEGIEVARRLGVDVGVTPDQRIDIARQLGRARISMLQDLEQGRPIELAAIVEAVMELADRVGVAVPVTRTLHALVRARADALGVGAGRDVAAPVR